MVKAERTVPSARPIGMRPRELVGVTLGCVSFAIVLGFAPVPDSDAGLSQFRQLARGIQLYSVDHDGVYPLAMAFEARANRWLPNRRMEAPAGLMRDTSPEMTQSYAAAWVNSVARYWPAQDVLVIAGAPTAPPYLKIEDTLKAPWRVGVTYNGYLHRLAREGVEHPEAVPLIWTGLGRANAEGYASSSPTLDCYMLMQQECVFNPKPNGSSSLRSMMFMALGPAAAFDGAMVFGMADGSAKRIEPHLKQDPYFTETDPWAQYVTDGRPISFFHDSDGYVKQFRPDRAPSPD